MIKDQRKAGRIGWNLGSGSIRETDITWKENGLDGFVSWSGRVGSGRKLYWTRDLHRFSISVRLTVLIELKRCTCFSLNSFLRLEDKRSRSEKE